MIIIYKTIDSKYEIYLELALIINKNIYNDKKITYHTYKITEDKILQIIKNTHLTLNERKC